MIERQPKIVDQITDEQFGSPYSLRARERLAELYLFDMVIVDRSGDAEHVGSSFSIDDVLIDLAAPAADQDWIDFGCGTGHLVKLLDRRGHTGRILGVERNPDLFYSTQARLTHRLNISFIKGDIRHLEATDPKRTGEAIESDSFDFGSAEFVLNHVGHPLQALAQAVRIIRENGTFLAAVRDRDHHWQIWQKLMLPITEELKEMQELGLTDQDPRVRKDYLRYPSLKTPQEHYHHFDFKRAEGDLQSMFQVVSNKIYLGELRIPLPGMSVEEGWEDLKLALLALQSSFRPRHKRPPHSDLEKAIDRSARQIYEAEVKEQGYFRVDTKEAIWVCRNIKNHNLTSPSKDFWRLPVLLLTDL